MTAQNKGTWGGRRSGSGRKAVGKKSSEIMAIRVNPAMKAELHRMAAAEGKSIKKLIEEMFAARMAGAATSATAAPEKS